MRLESKEETTSNISARHADHCPDPREMEDHVLMLWKNTCFFPTENVCSKVTELLSSILLVWELLTEETRESILSDITRLPWSSIYKQRCWVMLLSVVDKECFAKFEKVNSLWLLENIPNGFYKVPLAELISRIATPQQIADVFLHTSDYNVFLMKNVLSSLAKDPNFVIAVLEILVAAKTTEHKVHPVVGYGPILFTLRTTKQLTNEALRKKILKTYIFGAEDLAVFADDLVRLEAFSFFCDVSDPVQDFDREFIELFAN